jgi:hypothetical protein
VTVDYRLILPHTGRVDAPVLDEVQQSVVDQDRKSVGEGQSVD